VKIVVLRGARKSLDRLPRTQRERIETAIKALPRGDVKKLEARPEWRFRVGSWRVIFIPDADMITVTRVASRGDVYKE
jgi:mRNA interferase RelE/StbE